MNKIDLNKILIEQSQRFSSLPQYLKKLILIILEKVLCIDDINRFLDIHKDKKGVEFINELFEYIDFSYFLSSKDRLRIPSEGKLIIAANHPLGALDALSLISAVYEIRNDVVIIANDVLLNLDNLSDLFLPYSLYGNHIQKDNIKRIENALLEDKAIIIFPSGEVSRFTFKGIQDKKWQKGALWLATKYQVPVLPVFIEARNSLKFYIASFFKNEIGTFLLPREIFNKKSTSLVIKVGDPIPYTAFSGGNLKLKELTTLLKKHVYFLAKGRKKLFKTEKNIIHPVSRKQIIRDLKKLNPIGKTHDGKIIYLTTYDKTPEVLKEISRLREISFRKVGEGTGKTKDIDKYDKYYKHIVLWDQSALDIVGSYRIGECFDIVNNTGISGIYNNEQFVFNENFTDILVSSVEMGRSFIHPSYWNTNALNYLWQGIGAYLSFYPNIRFLWGSVSISNNYSDTAKDHVIYYYSKWYKSEKSFATSRNKYHISKRTLEELNDIFIGENSTEDFKILKRTLKNMGYTVPVLFRRYVDICHPGGVKFIDFAVDKNFSDSVDGLILVDLNFLRNEVTDKFYKSKSLIKDTLIKDTTAILENERFQN